MISSLGVTGTLIVYRLSDTLTSWLIYNTLPLDGVNVMSEAESREMERIEPEDMDHVTLAATVDTSDLSPPRCNWIIQQAE